MSGLSCYNGWTGDYSMKILYIYKITNLINGKIYVGKHSACSIDNSYMGSGIAIRRAIAKYGVDSFEKSILCLCSSEEEQNKKEIFWIETTGAFGDGYNMTRGGEGKLGYKPSKESIEQASKSRVEYYNNNPDARHNLSEKAKIRNVGTGNPFYGKKLSKEHIEKMTKARIKAISGANNSSAVKIMCIETGEVFETAKEAAVWCGLAYSTTILKSAKGDRKSAGGHTWVIV